jgi:histidinol-phosphatase (PHP family)
MTGVPLEINAGGFRKSQRQTPQGSRPPYPWSAFWELASDYRVTVVCNSDAHHPEDALANLDQAYDLAVFHGLTLAEADDLGLDSTLLV